MPVTPAFARLFRAHADMSGAMTFAQFMQLALYDPALGYYARPEPRVGYEPGTDFFTASTSGPIFGELIVAACVELLGARAPKDYHFVELGAETSTGILNQVAHPFASARTIQLGSPITLSGPCVVFSNELFDAQPFHRFIWRGGAWRELGVSLSDHTLSECELPTLTAAALPSQAPEGYIIDAPLAANRLLDQIAGETWQGLFVACDYGKSWLELTTATPAGTARAYYRHTQSNDLLVRPGEQDLTCHICWDWLEDGLGRAGFGESRVDSQESFFMNYAADTLAAITKAEAGSFSLRKRMLIQLLHPANMGQKFQALHALRK